MSPRHMLFRCRLKRVSLVSFRCRLDRVRERVMADKFTPFKGKAWKQGADGDDGVEHPQKLRRTDGQKGSYYYLKLHPKTYATLHVPWDIENARWP